MKAVLGALLIAAALGAAVMIRAEETPSRTNSGPVVVPLSRPADRTIRLEYPESVATSAGGSSSDLVVKPQSGDDLFSKFDRSPHDASAAPAAVVKPPLRLPAVYAAKPSLPAEEEVDLPVAQSASVQPQTMMTSDPARGAPSNSGSPIASNNSLPNDQPAANVLNGDMATPGNADVPRSNGVTSVMAATKTSPPNQLATPSSKLSAWRPIQAAFKQLTAPITSDRPPPPPGGTGPSLSPTPQTASPPTDATTPAMSSVKIEALPPWRTVPAPIDPSMYPSEIVMGDGTSAPPEIAGYVSGPHVPKSQCGYCSPSPPFGCTTCQSVRQGGPGCNSGDGGGGGCASGNCGSGNCDSGGGCNGGDGGHYSNWVNGNGLPIAGTPAYGSCLCERLACCFTTSYPDCSNGCVDFCHSWIFHEDCHWCTSNHKCHPPGCPENVYGGCAGGPNGCGCGCAQCVPAPDVYFTADALILTRNNQVNNQTLVTQTGTGDPLVSTGDFNFAYEVGPAITLGYRPTPWDAWELTYFGLMDWDSTQSLTGNANLNLPGAIGQAMDLNFFNADAMNITYSSVIHNAEANYFWTQGQIMWMAGFRYFHLGEDFDINSTSALGSTAYDISTRNDLYGGQLGARYRAGWERFNWDITAKAGAFGNQSSEQQSISNVGGIPIRNASDSSGQWAFVGDIGANLTYRLGPRWSLRGGYNLMWVEGVALAPNQLDFTDNPNSGTNINHNGGVFYYGAHAGIGCNW